VTDEAVSALAEAAFASCPGQWAVVALGAYGASRLLPHSDIDLLILSEVSGRQLKPYVERLLYPLWDAGLEVGQQVRSRSDHAKQCTQTLEILTSSLTGRPLAGDLAYAEAVLAKIAGRARRHQNQVLKALSARNRPGSPYHLEPDLKEGIGGQRDIDELVWRAAIREGAVRHRVSAPDREDDDPLCDAQDTITGGRWRVQATLRRKSSRFTLDIAPESGTSSMHAALATVDMLLRDARGDHDLEPPSGWTAADLLSALDEGTVSLPALERAAFRGEFDRLVSGMSELMTLRRPGLGHRLTVGAHMLRAAALVPSVGDEDPLAARVLRDPEGRRPLLAAALVHDAGKATPGGGHAQRGVSAATMFARMATFDDVDTRTTETLVREHLLLAETAATSDTQDDDVVLDVAARVGDVVTLGLLYVLTAADSMATGPGAWSRWHAALVGGLVGAASIALTEPGAATIADRAQLIRIEALEALPFGSPLASVVRAMHYRYLVDRDCATVIAEATLVDSMNRGVSGAPLAVRVTSGPVSDTYRLTVAALDRAGIFATIAGCITLAGLDIMDAEAHAVGRVVLDSFVVTSATAAGVDPATWNRLERELRAALAGNLALETRLEERRAHYANGECDTPITVKSDTGSARITSVRVTAPDRVGLLHDIATEMTRAGLTIVRARALVQDGMANDTFLVTDADGEAPRDPGLLGHLAMGIRERCG